MNRLKSGLEYLAEQITDHAASTIVYTHNNDTTTCKAVVGRSDIETIDNSGFAILVTAIDFVVCRDALDFAPEPRDTITCDGEIYEVLPLGNDGCWRWCDGYKTARRIHTKRKARTT